MVPGTLYHNALEQRQTEGAYRRPEKIPDHTDCQRVSKWAAAGFPAAATPVSVEKIFLKNIEPRSYCYDLVGESFQMRYRRCKAKT